MIMGYDDFGKHVKLCHMPLRALISQRRYVRIMNEARKDMNWGKVNPAGGCLRNWPYSLVTGNGHRPFG